MKKFVKYLGCSYDQIRFGNCDNPIRKLIKGNIYEVESEYVHSWHTKIKLVGIDGLFNSVCFEEE